MLDLKFIVSNKDFVKQKLTNRGEDFPIDLIDDLIEFYKEKNSYILKVEELKNKRNISSKSVVSIKKNW
ncbi:Seryl-tRNA synthetase 1 [Candidatus Arthromitus sp. SFB-4]|nr:Seryl-tRNA synthetase 1 [Candidatus Arthromitus sp. SFB-4]